MNVSINTSLKGVYIVLDANGNEIRRSDNIITDHGMARLVGDPDLGNQGGSLWNRAFVYNLSNLFIGSDDTSPSRTDWQLNSTITTGFTAENDPGATGTFINIDPSTDTLNIKFVKQNKYNFTSSATIKEVGCNWTTINTDSMANGIFSRALIDPVSVNDGDTVFLKYELTIQTNCHRVLESMIFDVKPGGIDLPGNRTNIRYFPFYRLLNTGLPENTLNNGVAKNTSTNRNRLSEQIPPLFEDFGLLNNLYVGSGSNDSGTTSTDNGPRVWRLQIYNNSAFPSWSNITSTTNTNFSNSSNLVPISTQSGTLKHININNNILIKDPPNNTWQRKLRFIFTPGEWNSVADRMILYTATNGKTNAGSNRRYYFIENSAVIDAGLLTTFQTPYNPYEFEPDPTNPDIFVGFDYTFTFTRLP